MNHDNIKFILINTSHPGNIGAAARAIKNMGFHSLTLVSPVKFPHEEAVARSSGAEDVLVNAQVVTDLKKAIADCQLVLGTSSRFRSLQWPTLNLKEAANKLKKTHPDGQQIGILFGCERTGLTNDELATCHYHIYIPSNPDFPSLNLAQAVQIVAYELAATMSPVKTEITTPDLATAQQMERFYEHLEQALIKLQFLDENNPRQMMRKLRRLFSRSQLEENELNILRGILSSVERQLN